MQGMTPGEVALGYDCKARKLETELRPRTYQGRDLGETLRWEVQAEIGRLAEGALMQQLRCQPGIGLQRDAQHVETVRLAKRTSPSPAERFLPLTRLPCVSIWR